ncbi:H-type lectin domain-containing protein [Actibacterium sp. XHP0104]|uniref:H-type lectin domain-containing protein n=1 Tax=Actibacterium sp. XHP0104 TaxID=2984335 RepID=UPI0021E9504E|nr:H-type lectin domain-containing protein [Actibacterium sp. XHP0104]MCV2882268.1 H-type lectin domain-containing protein [Actibacterium sp. XHP0104]
MKKIDGRCVGVDQGSHILFSDFEDDGEMWSGTGARAVRRRVDFAQAFIAIPSVQVSVSMWDMDQKTNFRADISAEDIAADGFTIVFKTWGDTRVARIRADWMAIGPVGFDDDWTL